MAEVAEVAEVDYRSSVRRGTAARGPAGNATAQCTSVFGIHLVQRLSRSPRESLQHTSFVYQFPRDGLVLVDSNIFPGVQDSRVATLQNVPNRHLTFFVEHKGGAILVFHIDIEDCAAYGNDCAWSAHPVVVRQSAGVFDLTSPCPARLPEDLSNRPGSREKSPSTSEKPQTCCHRKPERVRNHPALLR